MFHKEIMLNLALTGRSSTPMPLGLVATTEGGKQMFGIAKMLMLQKI